MSFKRPKLVFQTELPEPEHFGPSSLVIYDKRLNGHVPGLGRWLKKFGAAYGVTAGEELKDLSRFPGHMAKILDLVEGFSPRDMRVVIVGGGSVGDFGGFVASILKRGVGLVQIPSTWLSAMDSAHGGKTALNVGGIKNQIGTFYPASEIHLVRSLLFSQGSERARDAFGEFAKIALIDGGAWSRRLASSREKDGALIWKFLPQAIQAKYKVVLQDPLERKGIRQILNLGHTLGHAAESFYGLSHGEAVAQGLLFSVEWSFKRGLLKPAARAQVRRLLSETFYFQPLPEFPGFRKIPEERFLHLIRNDKKRSAKSEVGFVFVRDFGKTPLVPVGIPELLAEARAQGWVG